jgi:hypothetical protein
VGVSWFNSGTSEMTSLHPPVAQPGSGVRRKWRAVDVRVVKALVAFPPVRGRGNSLHEVIAEAMYRAEETEGAQFLVVFMGRQPSVQFVFTPVMVPKSPCWIYPLVAS